MEYSRKGLRHNQDHVPKIGKPPGLGDPLDYLLPIHDFFKIRSILRKFQGLHSQSVEFRGNPVICALERQNGMENRIIYLRSKLTESSDSRNHYTQTEYLRKIFLSLSAKPSEFAEEMWGCPQLPTATTKHQSGGYCRSYRQRCLGNELRNGLPILLGEMILNYLLGALSVARVRAQS